MLSEVQLFSAVSYKQLEAEIVTDVKDNVHTVDELHNIWMGTIQTTAVWRRLCYMEASACWVCYQY